MRVLICPDKFKGSATAQTVADAIAFGIRSETALIHTIVTLPLADGGDGTLEVLASQTGSSLFSAEVTGPLGDPVLAQWAMLADGTAVVEMAKASGLALVTGQLRACDATTYGTGELIMETVRAGASRCVVAVGGSATTDGGLGALDALGWSLHGLDVVVASDVTTTFIDAAAVFGPQKGASPDEVQLLTERLGVLAQRYVNELSVDVRNVPRSGAAGGLAGGLLALGAELVGGFEMIAELAGLKEQLIAADFVITGEGKADSTSFLGKPVGGVLERCAALGRTAAVVCGISELTEDQLPKRFTYQLVDGVSDVASAMANPIQLLHHVGRRIAAEHLKT
jgi:glycerate 2-kinase